MPRQLITRPWTADDDAELRRLCEGGTSLAVRAMRLRRSARAVRYRERLLARCADNGAREQGVDAPSSSGLT